MVASSSPGLSVMDGQKPYGHHISQNILSSLLIKGKQNHYAPYPMVKHQAAPRHEFYQNLPVSEAQVFPNWPKPTSQTQLITNNVPVFFATKMETDDPDLHRQATYLSYVKPVPINAPKPNYTREVVPFPNSVSPNSCFSQASETDSRHSSTSSRDLSSPSDKDSGIFTDSEQDEPMDLSRRQISTPKNIPCEEFKQEINEMSSSFLRDLLSRNRPQSVCSNNQDVSLDSSNVRVALAKKNLLPVSARVSDWLVKIVTFAESLKEFKFLSKNDKFALILHSWPRLLALYMAENNFSFVVSPEHDSNQLKSEIRTNDPGIPTSRSVEQFQNVLKKFHSLNLDSRQYDLLRTVILFHIDAFRVENPEVIEKVRRQTESHLQEHCNITRHGDVLHHSRILMTLPLLYNIDFRLMENLFCRHITGDSDVTVFLKEMLMSTASP